MSADNPNSPVAQAVPSIARKRFWGISPRWWLFLAYALLSFRLFRLVFKYAVNLFTWDQWDFNNATLFQVHSLWQIFRWQHGPHRQGLGGVLAKLLEPTIHWNTRYEAFGICGIVVITAVLALLLKRKLFGSISISDIAIPLIFLTPIQYEILVGTTNPSHGSLPALMTVLFCFCWTLRNRYWKYATLLLINFLMTYTGFGLFMGFVTPGLLALDSWRSVRSQVSTSLVSSVTSLVLSIVSLMTFFHGYVLSPAVDCFSMRPKSPSSYVHFISLMFANFIEIKEGEFLPFLLGAVILCAVLACFVVSVTKIVLSDSNFRPTFVVVAALSGYCLLFAVGTSYGRLCLGLRAAQSSRYTPYLISGFFALYLSALLIRKTIWQRLALIAVLLLAMFSSARLHKFDRWMVYGSSRSRREWKNCYIAYHNIGRCDDLAKHPIYPNPAATHLQEKLDFLESNHLNLFSDPDYKSANVCH